MAGAGFRPNRKVSKNPELSERSSERGPFEGENERLVRSWISGVVRAGCPRKHSTDTPRVAHK